MIVYRGKNKLRNQPTWVGKYRFASKKEAARYRELLLKEKAGLIRNLKIHPIYKLEVMGYLICRYIADFDYFDLDQQKIVVEDVKGWKAGTAYNLFKLKANLLYALTGLKVQEI